mmetsp:Transcript_97431/g.209050  ORF Transcript_97431/g.209050 Transcript_97431/m.209050 type:complete len:229 (+) Transcript_97431:350-1036(+)
MEGQRQRGLVEVRQPPARSSTQCTAAGDPQTTATACEAMSTAQVHEIPPRGQGSRSATCTAAGARKSQTRTIPAASTSNVEAELPPRASHARMPPMPETSSASARAESAPLLLQTTVSVVTSTSSALLPPRAAAMSWPPPDPPMKWRPARGAAMEVPLAMALLLLAPLEEANMAQARLRRCAVPPPTSLMGCTEIWPSRVPTARASCSGAKSKASMPERPRRRKGGKR